jgi:hypothetical protein
MYHSISKLSDEELNKKLQKYSIENKDRDEAINSLFEPEYYDYLVKNVKEGSLETFSQRCTNVRKQRFISEKDELFVKNVLFKQIKDYKFKNVSLIWVHRCCKFSLNNNNFSECRAKSKNYVFGKNGDDVYFLIVYTLTDKLGEYQYTLHLSKDFKELVKDKMSYEDYYYYRTETELVSYLYTARDIRPRKQSESVVSKTTDMLLYIMFKLSKDVINEDCITSLDKNTKPYFDKLQNVKFIYWCNFQYQTNTTNYILYKNDLVYTLFKFDMVIENKKLDFKRSHIYVSSKYEDIINFGLTKKEFEMYMNQTNYSSTI